MSTTILYSSYSSCLWKGEHLRLVEIYLSDKLYKINHRQHLLSAKSSNFMMTWAVSTSSFFVGTLMANVWYIEIFELLNELWPGHRRWEAANGTSGTEFSTDTRRRKSKLNSTKWKLNNFFIMQELKIFNKSIKLKSKK